MVERPEVFLLMGQEGERKGGRDVRVRVYMYAVSVFPARPPA